MKIFLKTSVVLLMTLYSAISFSHINKLTIQSQNPISSLKFVVGEHKITSNKTYKSPKKGVSFQVTSQSPELLTLTIIVDAERKGSTDPAKWFADKISPNSGITHNQLGSTQVGLPGKLNFALHGTLQINNGDPVPITIGQGTVKVNLVSLKNWWVGSSNGEISSNQCLPIGDSSSMCVDSDSLFLLY